MSESEKNIGFMIEALTRAGITGGASVEEVAQRLTAHLTPKIVVVERTSEKLVLDITSSVDGSLFCGITTGNQNLGAYVFPNGHQNAMTRVGHFDHIVSDFLSREMLVNIALIALIRPVPLGATVRVSIVLESKSDSRTTCKVMAHDLKTGKPLMKPSSVTTWKKQK